MEVTEIMPPADSEEEKPPRFSLRTSLGPLFLLSRVWGFAPINIHQSRLISGKWDLFYSTCLSGILITTHVSTIFFEIFTNGPSNRHVRYIARTGVVIFNRFCGIGNVILLLIYRKMIVSAVSSVVALDEEWKPAGNEKAATFIYVELALMFSVILSESYSLVIEHRNWPLLFYGMWQSVAAIQSLSLLILQWTNLMCSLVRQMRSLNDELIKQYPEGNCTFTQRTTTTSKKEWMLFLIKNEINQGCRDKLQSEDEPAQMFSNISLLRRYHRDIYGGLQKLQAAYGGPLAVGFAIVLVNSVIAVFRVKNSSGDVNTVHFIWALWKIVMSFLMVFPCQILLDKTQKCADILHSAMQNDLQSNERKRLLNFSIQLLDLPLSCSCCNFFQLDNRKLISIRQVSISTVDGQESFSDRNSPPVTIKPKWRGARAAFRPLLLISKIWGLAPFSLGPVGPPKASSIVFNILFIFMLLVFHICTVVYVVFDNTPYRHILYVTTIGVILFNRVCALLNHVFLLAYRSSLISAVSSIVALDDEWRPVGSKQLAAFVNVELGGLFVCILTEILLSVRRIYKGESPILLAETIVQIAVITSLTLLVLQWTNLVLSLAYHMDALIVELTKLYPPTDDSFSMVREPPTKNNWRFLLIENELCQGVRRVNNNSSKPESPSTNIPSLRRLHRDIHSALQKLQTAYGGPLTIGFSVAIINTVMGVFDLRYRLDEKSVMWVAWCAVTTYLMVMPCQMLLDKTQKCADVLHGAMQNDIRPEERKQVLGTIVTYVIILSQFDSSNKANDLPANKTNCSTEESP